MRIKDLKISTQLIGGNVIIIILVLFLTGLAYFQTVTIVGYMNDLYEHPYQVGRATRDINTNCAMIHSYMKNIVFDKELTYSDILDIEHKIEMHEKATYELFNVVYDRYLGEKVHIDSAFATFSDWKRLRDKLIFMKQHGMESEIIPRFRRVNQPYVDKLFNNIAIMIDFSGRKAQSFHDNAMSESRTILIRLMILLMVVILLIVIINYYFIRRIYEPLRGLTSAAEQYTAGNYNSDYVYESGNEFGLLSRAFQEMASTFRNDIKLKETTAEIAIAFHEECDLKSFSKNLMKKLVETTNSQLGAFYLLNENEKVFKPYYSIGMSTDKMKSFSSEVHEGEFGLLLSSKRIHILRDIPDDTVFLFETVPGTFRPKEIISIPVLNNTRIIGIISLGSLRTYNPLITGWIKDIWPTLSARINGTISSQKILDYSVMVDDQNKELGFKNKELSQQAEELREYNLELNIQKKQLNQVNQLKTTFLSNMSHELRTPLNSVIALSSVLTKKLKGRITDDEFNYVSIIERNGKELLALINDILDLSRIEAGKEVLTYSRFSLHELISTITDNLLPLVQEKGLNIKNRVDPRLPVIVTDRVKCTHILQNIIHNAIKFTDQGKIEIDANANGNEIVVRISDTGIGIEPDKLSVIFDEFRQADERSSRKYGGSGLGLAIAQKYCHMLGGNIEVASTPGFGSVFTVILPVEPLNIENYREENQDGLAEVQSSELIISDKSILIVEDSEPAIIQIREFLQSAGYNVLVARNGTDAIEMITKSLPDVIILDLMMPETDGFEVLSRLRGKEISSKIPVLILTAKNVTAEELESL
ncbi:MAG TPA: ATP-binding protein, partial [Bacteroidales bacterium]|nr:ATP-binding protein [Bacteroidales bacterium]